MGVCWFANLNRNDLYIEATRAVNHLLANRNNDLWIQTLSEKLKLLNQLNHPETFLMKVLGSIGLVDVYAGNDG